jgi:hypothetical protein
MELLLLKREKMTLSITSKLCSWFYELMYDVCVAPKVIDHRKSNKTEMPFETNIFRVKIIEFSIPERNAC